MFERTDQTFRGKKKPISLPATVSFHFLVVRDTESRHPVAHCTYTYSIGDRFRKVSQAQRNPWL